MKELNKVLNEGLKMFVPIIDNMGISDRRMCQLKGKEFIEVTTCNEVTFEDETVSLPNDGYKRHSEKMAYWFDKKEWDLYDKIYRWNLKAMEGALDKEFTKFIGKEDILKYLELDYFNTSYMINVSPNWKGTEITGTMCGLFRKTFKEWFKNCDRFNRYAMVLECGKDTPFLHLHGVVEGREGMNKSNYSANKKGNLQREFRNVWKKVCHDKGDWEGWEGIDLNIQISILNTRDIRKDKLDYLIESRKPLSHQNKKHPLCPLLDEQGTGWASGRIWDKV